MSTTNDEDNDETKNPIETAKKSPSAAAQMYTALFTSIDAVTIVATKAPVFPIYQVTASLSSIYTSRKPSPIAAETVVATRAPVEILTRRPIDKKKSLIQPITNIVFPSAKAPASLL